MSDTLQEGEDQLPLVSKNHSERECSEPDCPCHEWAKRDAINCPRCGRTMQSDFDPDVGMWYECVECDYREAVSPIEPVSYSGPQRCWRHGKTSCELCPAPTTTEHQPAARGGGDGELSVRDFDYHQYGDVTLNVTNSGITVAIAYMQGRGREAKEWAEKISAVYNQYQYLVAEREQMVEALKGVAIMLNTELEKYNKEPWAQRVRAAITTSEQRSTSE